MSNESIFLKKEQIEVNPLNNWENGNMEDLIDSIETYGLITPLSVIGPMENGIYRLISGERRYKSSCEVMKKTNKEFIIPCYIVGEGDMSNEMQRILIETANLEARETDVKTLNEHRANVMEQLLILSDNKEIKEHNVAKKAAEIFKTSDTYARFWQRIFRKGIPSLKELVKSGDLGIKSANKIVNFSEEEQEKAVQEIEQHILTKDKNKPKEDTKVTIQDIIDNISTKEDTLDLVSNKDTVTETEDTSFLDENTQNIDVVIDDDIEEEFNALFGNTKVENEKHDYTSKTPKNSINTKTFCDLDDFDPFNSDDCDYEDSTSYSDSFNSFEQAHQTDDEYVEKLNMIHSWCKQIVKKDDLTDEEWCVVEACKEVVDCFM